MLFYTKQHQHFCGIDLHARTMYVCIIDKEGKTIVHRNMRATADNFLTVIEPYRQDICVAVECTFTWYWLADLCAREGIPFVLGHALYLKAIHGGKTKNDKIDSRKIAVILRGGMYPLAYVYPGGMRPTRDLLRRRIYLRHNLYEFHSPGLLGRLTALNRPAFNSWINSLKLLISLSNNVPHDGISEGE